MLVVHADDICDKNLQTLATFSEINRTIQSWVSMQNVREYRHVFTQNMDLTNPLGTAAADISSSSAFCRR